MAEADGSLCRAVIDVYRGALTDAFDEVTRRVGSAVHGCGREAAQEATQQGRLTLFTRCLAQRVSASKRGG